MAGTQVSDSFPFKWINKKWKEGFYVTSMATSHTRWAVVMSRNAGFVDQCVELDFQYPSEGIHRRWDAGGKALRVNSMIHSLGRWGVMCSPSIWLVHSSFKPPSNVVSALSGALAPWLLGVYWNLGQSLSDGAPASQFEPAGKFEARLCSGCMLDLAAAPVP